MSLCVCVFQEKKSNNNKRYRIIKELKRFSIDHCSPCSQVEVESACRENLRCLNTLLESISGSFRTEKYTKQVRGEYGQIQRRTNFTSYINALLIIALSGIILMFLSDHSSTDRLISVFLLARESIPF